MSQTEVTEDTPSINTIEILERIVHAIEIIQEVQADIIAMKEMLEKHNLNPHAHTNIRLTSSNIVS